MKQRISFSASGHNKEIFSNNILGCRQGPINYTWVTNHTSGRVHKVLRPYELNECTARRAPGSSAAVRSNGGGCGHPECSTHMLKVESTERTINTEKQLRNRHQWGFALTLGAEDTLSERRFSSIFLCFVYLHVLICSELSSQGHRGNKRTKD